MYIVYVLKDSKNKLYVGLSKNIERRLNEHLNNKVWTTKRMLNPKLIYLEGFIAKYDAMRREKYLKTTKGKRTLKLMLKYSLI